MVRHSTNLADCSPGIASIPARRRVSILGSTGSVGCNTLDVVDTNADRYCVEALTAFRNVALLAEQARLVSAKFAVIGDPSLFEELKQRLSDTTIEVASGPEALIEAAQRPADIVMASIVGAAGLAPTLAAVRQGTDVALANKECLVSAGSLFMKEVSASACTLLPVDSEHNAIFQALDGNNCKNVSRIILTASGGPFRTWSLDDMQSASPKQALNHPNWSMGDKLTIDSATMMNKGLELIEAHHLFATGPDKLDVLVHPQSVVHGMVEYKDGSILAQLGSPDMRKPISYALGWPDRLENQAPKLKLEQLSSLTFESVDADRFPAIGVCRDCMLHDASASTVLNAANEIAVERFLAGAIGFLEITGLVMKSLDCAMADGMLGPLGDLDDVTCVDQYSRTKASVLAQGLQ